MASLDGQPEWSNAMQTGHRGGSDLEPGWLARTAEPLRNYFRQRIASARQPAAAGRHRLTEAFEAEFRSDATVVRLRRLFDGLAELSNAGMPRLAGLQTGIRYDPASSATLDVLVPRGPGPHPVMVYLHGGAWVAGSPKSHRKLTARIAEAGYLVFSVDYRLAPEHPFPAGLNDCVSAIGWTVRNAHSYGGDPARLAVGGDSAGANLAAAAALSLRSAVSGPKISALALIYGVFDMSDLGSASANRILHDAYLAGEPAGQLADFRVSPLLAADKLPPSFVVVGTRDSLLDQSRALRDGLDLAGTPHVLIEEPGMPHGFMQMEFLGRTRSVVQLMRKFLNVHLAETPRSRFRKLRMQARDELRAVLGRRLLRGRMTRRGEPRGRHRR